MVKKASKIIRFFVFIAVAAVFVVLLFLITNKKDVSEKSEILPAVVVQKPVRSNIVESVTISGYVEAKAMIPVVPFVLSKSRIELLK